MADIEAHLKLFDKKLNISDSKKEKLKKSRDYLKGVIKKGFKDYGYELSNFFIQGSYKTKTMIRTKDDTCDLDLGIRLKEKPNFKTDTIFKHIKEITDNITNSESNIKKKCVRVNYSDGYHIDLPIYYRDKGNTYICVKDEEDELSDMEAFIGYFKENANKKIRRQVKYLKAICDKLDRKMPSGIALTVLVIENYEDVESDELLNFINTIKNIIKYLDDNNFVCRYPVEPFDDLLSNLNNEQKDNSYDEFKNLLVCLKEIRDTEYLDDALKIAKTLFGKWFEKDLKESVGNAADKLLLINSGKAKTNKDGQINENVGVKNKKHSFYGE